MGGSDRVRGDFTENNDHRDGTDENRQNASGINPDILSPSTPPPVARILGSKWQKIQIIPFI